MPPKSLIAVQVTLPVAGPGSSRRSPGPIMPGSGMDFPATFRLWKETYQGVGLLIVTPEPVRETVSFFQAVSAPLPSPVGRKNILNFDLILICSSLFPSFGFGDMDLTLSQKTDSRSVGKGAPV